MKRITDSMLVLAVVLTLAGLALLGWRMFFDAPLVWQLESVRVLAGDGPVTLGAHELGQHTDSDPAAAARQLQVESDNGRWWLADIAADQPVKVSSAGRDGRSIQRWRLAVGDRVTVASVIIEVAAVTATSLELLAGDADGEGREHRLRATWQNGHLDTGTTPFGDCPYEGAPWWQHRLDRWWGRELSLFSIGGQVDCPRRWRLAGLPFDSVRVVWVGGGFWLAPGTAGIEVAMQEAEHSEARSFEQLQLPIGSAGQDVQRVALGGSSYRLSGDAGDLILRPDGGNDVWREDEVRPPPRDPRVVVQYQLQRWVGSGDGPREWLQAHTNWFMAALLLSTLAVLRYLRALRRRRASAAASLVPASLFGLVLSLGMWLQPGLDARWLFWMGWLGWGWTSVVLLEAHRLRGYGGALWLTAVLLTGSGAVLLGQLATGGDDRHWLELAIDHWGLWSITAWGLGLLAPVTTATWRRLLLQLFESRTWPWMALRMLLPGLLIALLAVKVALGYEPGQFPSWLPQTEHFRDWAALAGLLHSGESTQGMMDLVRNGGWWGALSDGWGWSGWNHSTMRLPTIQNDLVVAFALYRFGAAAGLALLLVQLTFLGLLFNLGGRFAHNRTGMEVVVLAGRGVSLVLYGLAWLFVANWAIAWVHVLGLLPVSAQPMIWLAADGSSVALFAYPALAFALVVAWSRPAGQANQ